MTDKSGEQSRELPRMSAGQARELAAAVAAVTADGLPLADGLRAAAVEASNGGVARELRRIADEIQRGRSLDEVLGDGQSRLPGYVAGLIRAALRTGHLGEVLIELVDHQQAVRDMWRTIHSALAYPFFLLMVTLAVGLWIEIFLVGPMVQMIDDFGLDMPSMTRFLAWGHHEGLRLCVGFLSAVLTLAGVLRIVGGAARWRRVMGTVPIIGVLWHWSGVAELSRILAVLVEQGIPLPEALNLAADGTRDPDMSQLSRQLAGEVEQGQALSDLIARSSRLPPTLAPIVGWGERSGELAEAFRRAGEMFEGRIAMRAELVQSIGPPILFVFVATIALLVVFGLYMPVISMIQGLS